MPGMTDAEIGEASPASPAGRPAPAPREHPVRCRVVMRRSTSCSFGSQSRSATPLSMSSELAFAPVRMVVLPFHDDITIHFDSSEDATGAASLPRNLKLRYTTRVGTVGEVGIIRGRPARIQRRALGLHPFFKSATEQVCSGENPPSDPSARGAHPRTNYYAENSSTGRVRPLFTIRWRDGAAGEKVHIVEIVLDTALADALKTGLLAIRAP